MEPKELIREQIDVADLVGEYLQLKKAGQGSFKAICPFHSEKTPSLYVSRPKQIWHCFGCDKGGDIFAFMMDMEGVEFIEALQLLAKKAGVALPKFEKKNTDKNDRLKAINQLAAEVYSRYMSSNSGIAVREYIKKRGFKEETLMAFGIGYAPDSYTALIDIARKKGVSEKELQDAGLALPSRRGGSIDRFRHRLMIPFRDPHGNTIGFTGRVLRKEDTPKYMNSPQTPIYDKGGFIFGLDLAKTAIKKAGEVILVEGNLDVLASYQAGVTNVVATSGTAFTERQLKLLKRYTTKLVFCFDADAAGFEAARRGMRLAIVNGFEVRVIPLNDKEGKDPDEVVKKSPERWVELVENHVDHMTYLYERIVSDVDISSVSEKTKAGTDFMNEIRTLQSPIEREHWLKRLSEAVDTPIGQLRSALKNKDSAPVPVHSSKASEKTKETPEKHTITSLDDLFLSLVINDQDLLKLSAERVSTDLLEGAAKDLYKISLTLYNSTHLSQTEFFETLKNEAKQNSEELARYAERVSLLHLHEPSTEISNQGDKTTFFHGLVDKLVDRSQVAKRAALLRALKLAERQQDANRVEELTRQYQALL